MRRNEKGAPKDAQGVEALLQDLNLTTIAQGYASLVKAAEERKLSYTDFLRTLLTAERDARFQRKRERMLKRSHLLDAKTLDQFDFSLRPQLNPAAVKELSECRYIEEKRNILLLGKPGLGKTHVARALGRAACERGHSVRFVVTAEMLDDLHGALVDGTYPRAFRRYQKPALLVCDEFGYLDFDRKLAAYLFKLVAARHRTASIVLTANTGFKNWARFFPSEAQAIATIDRLVDRATILRFTGKSLREPQDVLGAALED